MGSGRILDPTRSFAMGSSGIIDPTQSIVVGSRGIIDLTQSVVVGSRGIIDPTQSSVVGSRGIIDATQSSRGIQRDHKSFSEIHKYVWSVVTWTSAEAISKIVVLFFTFLLHYARPIFFTTVRPRTFAPVFTLLERSSDVTMREGERRRKERVENIVAGSPLDESALQCYRF